MLRTCHSRVWEIPRQCLGFLKGRREGLGIGRSAVMLRTCHSRVWENPRQCLGFLKVRVEGLGIGRSAVMLRTCHSRVWENPRQCLGFLKVRVEGLGIGRSEGLPPGLQKEMQRDQIPGSLPGFAKQVQIPAILNCSRCLLPAKFTMFQNNPASSTESTPQIRLAKQCLANRKD